MTPDVELILKVAGFASPTGERYGSHWEGVHFRGTAVYAQTEHGGMLATLEDVKVTCSVSRDLLVKALRALSKGEHAVTFKVNKQALVITCDASTAELPLMDTSSAPAFYAPDPKLKWHVVEGLDAIARVAWAVSLDQTRPHLCTVRLCDDGFEAVDGTVMSRLETDTKWATVLGRRVQVYPEFMTGLGSGRRWIACDEKHLFVSEDEAGTRYRVLKCAPDSMPDLSQLIPQRTPLAKVSREALLAALKRVKSSARYVTLRASHNRLAFESEAADAHTLFAIHDSIEIESPKNYPSAPINLDIGKLVAALGGLVDDEFQLGLDTGITPVVVRAGSYIAIVMPRRA